MLKRIWADDGGALLSAEWVFMATIIVIGLVTGLVNVRNAVVGELTEVAGAVSSLDQTYGFTWLQADGCCFTAGSWSIDVADPRHIQQSIPAPNVVDNAICES